MTILQKLISLIIPFGKRRSWYDRRNESASDTEPDIDSVNSAITSAESGNWHPFQKLVKQMLSNDGHIQTEVAKRKLALLGDPMTFRPASKAPADVAAAEFCRKWADDYTGFTDGMLHALDGIVWPVAQTEKTFHPGTNGRRFDIRLEPVDFALLDYRDGCLKIQHTQNGAPTGNVFTPSPAQYWAYRGHLSTLADQRGGPARPLLFWYFMSHCSYNWWGRFLERFGAPFLVGRVSDMDTDESYKLEAAFKQATRLFGVVVSRDTEIEMLEGKASDGGRAYEAMHRLCQEEKSKIILGGIASTQGVKSALNGNSAETLDKVRGEFRAWDSFRLGTSFRAHVLTQFLHLNSIPGSPPTPVWGDLAGNEIAGDLLVQLSTIGIIPAENALAPLETAVGVPLRWATADTPRTPRDPANPEHAAQLSAGWDDPFPWVVIQSGLTRN